MLNPAKKTRDHCVGSASAIAEAPEEDISKVDSSNGKWNPVRPGPICLAELGPIREADATSPPDLNRERRSSSEDTAISGATAEGIEDELQRLLESNTFSRSPRLRKMLHYIVKQALAGGGYLLTGYNLGVKLFDRDKSFEPALDPIVRVQASRLRNQLARYYAGEGYASTLRIDVPKGTYTPVISKHRLAKSVIVLPFSLLPETPNIAGAAYVLTISDRLIYLLTLTPGIRVASRITSAHFDPALDAQRIGARFGAQFIVEGTITTSDDQGRVILHLAETRQGYNIWSGCYDTDLDALVETTDLASRDLLAAIRNYSDAR